MTEILRPNGDFNVNCLVYPGASANHYELIDEEINDEGSTYIHDSPAKISTSPFDLFEIPNSSVGTGTINKVTVKASFYTTCLQDQCYCALMVRTHNNNYYKGNYYVNQQGVWVEKIGEWTTNPNTNNAWVWDEINNMKIGVELTAFSGLTIRCSQVYVEIDYTADTPPDNTPATRGFYRRWYGSSSNMSDVPVYVRTGDKYFTTDTHKLYTWDGTQWVKFTI